MAALFTASLKISRLSRAFPTERPRRNFSVVVMNSSTFYSSSVLLTSMHSLPVVFVQYVLFACSFTLLYIREQSVSQSVCALKAACELDMVG